MLEDFCLIPSFTSGDATQTWQVNTTEWKAQFHQLTFLSAKVSLCGLRSVAQVLSSPLQMQTKCFTDCDSHTSVGDLELITQGISQTSLYYRQTGDNYKPAKLDFLYFKRKSGDQQWGQPLFISGVSFETIKDWQRKYANQAILVV